MFESFACRVEKQLKSNYLGNVPLRDKQDKLDKLPWLQQLTIWNY